MPAGAYRHAIACVEDVTDFRDRIRRPGVEVVALHRSKIGTQRLRRELYRLCRRLRPALVHTRNLSGLDALLPARLAGVRHAVHGEHGWDVDNLHGQQWKPALLRRLHRPLVDRYVTVSQDLQRFLVERIGVPPRRVTQIYNGVDTERFAPAAPAPSATAAAEAAALLPPAFQGPGLLRIGTVGRLQAVKDQASLLQAFAALLQREPALRERARLLVVGDGPLEQPLRQQAQALGIAALTWFSGPSSKVPALLRAIDVFVLPSLNEGISNTILEALATGLPVLASDAGGNPELVTPDLSGALFAPGDVQALTALLQRYASDDALRRRHGEAARRSALERFSLPAMVARYQGVYDGLLA
jgi:sugar transferase (PEP-CTERM/EpsH1 system associated)